jgi:hypothetical protein
MGVKSLWLVALLACSSLAAEVKISGPTTARTGDLVVINAKESTGKAFKWLMPPGLATLSCSELEFGFASGTPGVYTFTLIAADTESEGVEQIAVATHTVNVGGVDLNPEEPEPEQPPPDVPTPGLFEALRQLSKNSAAALNDRDTANGLAETIQIKANEIEAMCERGQCPTLDGARRMMVTAIENRLLARAGNSRNVNWADGWRSPVNNALLASNTQTVALYLAAMRAVAVGLSQS